MGKTLDKIMDVSDRAMLVVALSPIIDHLVSLYQGVPFVEVRAGPISYIGVGLMASYTTICAGDYMYTKYKIKSERRGDKEFRGRTDGIK